MGYSEKVKCKETQRGEIREKRECACERKRVRERGIRKIRRRNRQINRESGIRMANTHSKWKSCKRR